MANSDDPRIYEVVTVDPNFSVPFGVRDLGYLNPDNQETEATERSDETGEVVSVEYDEMSDPIDFDSSPAPGSEVGIYPPDSVTVVSQILRQTNDGRYVVDVVIEVEDMPGVNQYEVGLTKI